MLCALRFFATKRKWCFVKPSLKHGGYRWLYFQGKSSLKPLPCASLQITSLYILLTFQVRTREGSINLVENDSSSNWLQTAKHEMEYTITLFFAEQFLVPWPQKSHPTETNFGAKMVQKKWNNYPYPEFKLRSDSFSDLFTP